MSETGIYKLLCTHEALEDITKMLQQNGERRTHENGTTSKMTYRYPHLVYAEDGKTIIKLIVDYTLDVYDKDGKETEHHYIEGGIQLNNILPASREDIEKFDLQVANTNE